MLENYDDVIHALEPMLVPYLEEMGIEAANGKLFSCLDPEHEDTDPSCRVIPDDPIIAHCFGCQSDFTIFKAAHCLEGKPLHGAGFITENVLYLAEKFNIPYSVRPLTPEEQYQQKVYKAYNDAAEFIISQPLSKEAKKEIERRGWDINRMSGLGIGCVPNFQSFRQHMISQGWEESFLDEVDLGLFEGRPHPMFGSNMLIFTVRNEYGAPCGFAGRNLSWTPEHDGASKFWNSKTLERGDIYRKSERLYNLDKCKNRLPLYIVEGYGDVISLILAGITNVVCLGGTAFTSDHYRVLLKNGFRDIILALDGDDAGQKRTEKIITSHLSGTKDLKISVLPLPEELDPDEFIRAKGVDAWYELEPVSGFAWRLSRFPADTDPEELCAIMLPLIINEVSPIRQEMMCRELAVRTGLRIDTIFKELDRHQDIRRAEMADKKEALIKRGFQDALRDPESAAITVRNLTHQIEELDKANDKNIIATPEYIESLEEQCGFERNKKNEQEIFHLGPRLKPAEPLFEGADVKEALCILGGVANCGKTNLLSQMAVEFAQYNPNTTVIFHTIDDNRKQLISKLLMHLLGDEAGDIELNWLKHPNYYEKFDQGLKTKHKIAYDRLIQLASQDRLIVKDMNLGTNTMVIDSLISHYRDLHPERDIVFFLDNFSLLQTLANSDKQEDHYKLRETATEIKRIAQRYRALVIMTQEYTKVDIKKKPTMNELKGSSGILYDANIIMHLYSDMRGNPDEAEFYHFDHKGRKLPVIEWIFEKTKVNAFQFTANSVFMKSIPYKAQSTIIPTADALRMQAEAKALKTGEESKIVWNRGKGTEVPQRATKAVN